MSYDGWVMLRLPDGREDHELDDLGNYTSNVAPMWRHALTAVTGEPTRLSDTEGWGCGRAALVLRDAVAVMRRDEVELRAMEPANGWGDYDGALDYLCRVRDACERFAPVAGAYLHWWV